MKPLSQALSFQSSSFTAPLNPSAHRLAQRFCQHHRDPQKVMQVYLNTLAVSAVEFYLHCMGIKTNQAASQSHDPVMQLALDVADLELPGKGKLDCRPLLPDASMLTIPPEGWRNRVAAVAVQFPPSLQEATLLGFAPAGVQEIALDQLRSLDDLLVYLDAIQPLAASRVHLSRWLEDLFETGWQSLAGLTGVAQPRLAATFRNSAETAVQRAKLIDLGVHLGAESVALLVAINPMGPAATESEEPMVEVWVQLHPTGETSYLPHNISLSLLSEQGETLQTVISRQQDNYVQLKRFRGTPGECFDIRVAFGETRTTESFVI